MDNSANNITEQLVIYLDGALTGAEKKAVEDLLASDTLVQSEYESLLKTRAAIRHYGLKKLVTTIHKEIIKEVQTPVLNINRRRKILRYSMAAAVSILFLIGAYMISNLFDSNLSSEKIFSSNYKTYELSVTRSGYAGLTPVEKAYGEKNYTEVLRIHDAGEDKSAKAEFLTGAASLETKNNSKAIKCFNEVIDMNKGAATVVLNEESEYYLALAYIKNKDYDFALPLLNKIKDTEEHKYHNEVLPGLIKQVKALKGR